MHHHPQTLSSWINILIIMTWVIFTFCAQSVQAAVQQPLLLKKLTTSGNRPLLTTQQSPPPPHSLDASETAGYCERIDYDKKKACCCISSQEDDGDGRKETTTNGKGFGECDECYFYDCCNHFKCPKRHSQCCNNNNNDNDNNMTNVNTATNNVSGGSVTNNVNINIDSPSSSSSSNGKGYKNRESPCITIAIGSTTWNLTATRWIQDLLLLLDHQGELLFPCVAAEYYPTSSTNGIEAVLLAKNVNFGLSSRDITPSDLEGTGYCAIPREDTANFTIGDASSCILTAASSSGGGGGEDGPSLNSPSLEDTCDSLSLIGFNGTWGTANGVKLFSPSALSGTLSRLASGCRVDAKDIESRAAFLGEVLEDDKEIIARVKDPANQPAIGILPNPAIRSGLTLTTTSLNVSGSFEDLDCTSPDYFSINPIYVIGNNLNAIEQQQALEVLQKLVQFSSLESLGLVSRQIPFIRGEIPCELEEV